MAPPADVDTHGSHQEGSYNRNIENSHRKRIVLQGFKGTLSWSVFSKSKWQQIQVWFWQCTRPCDFMPFVLSLSQQHHNKSMVKHEAMGVPPARWRWYHTHTSTCSKQCHHIQPFFTGVLVMIGDKYHYVWMHKLHHNLQLIRTWQNPLVFFEELFLRHGVLGGRTQVPFFHACTALLCVLHLPVLLATISWSFSHVGITTHTN
jgi:hypothetical protein